MASRKIFTQGCIQWIGARLDQDGVHVRIDRGGVTGGKPFFLGDMRSQCRPQCAHCACNGPVASGKKFYTEVYSFFFFLGSSILTLPHWAFMAQWPDGVWKKTPLHFFFLVPWAMSLPMCANEKKTKNLQKKMQKKSPIKRIL